MRLATESRIRLIIMRTAVRIAMQSLLIALTMMLHLLRRAIKLKIRHGQPYSSSRQQARVKYSEILQKSLVKIYYAKSFSCCSGSPYHSRTFAGGRVGGV